MCITCIVKVKGLCGLKMDLCLFASLDFLFAAVLLRSRAFPQVITFANFSLNDRFSFTH